MNNACVSINRGSGFFASENYIVTCHHLFSNSAVKAGDLLDYCFKGQAYKAKVIAVEEEKDLVLMHAETAPYDHSFLKLDRVAVPGSSVIVYGYPHNNGNDVRQTPAEASVGEADENGNIVLNNSNSVTVGYSGGPVCPKTILEDYNPGRPDKDSVVGVLRIIMGRDSYGRQIEISKMIPASIVLDLWGNHLEEARYTVAADPRNPFVYNSLKTVFVDPDGNLEDLKRFTEDPSPVRWRAVIAEGGSGKSRLAYEFAHSLPSTWRCCCLRPSDLTTMALDETYRAAGRDLLIIADYAYTDTNELGKWLSKTIKAENSRSYPHRIRVLLLQRHGENKNDRLSVPWMTSLLFDENLKEERYHERDLVLKKLDKPQLIKIMQTYAESRAQEHGKVDFEALYTTLIRVDKDFARPLFAMFITDAMLNGDSPTQWDTDTALTYFINRELNLLKGAVSHKDHRDAAKRLWVLATIIGGYAFTTDMLPDVITEENSAVSAANLGHELARACFAKKDKRSWTMYPMTPDILGEYFVMKYAQSNPVVIEELLNEALQTNKNCTKDFLTRMFADHPADQDIIELFSRNDWSLSLAVSWGLVMRGDHINLQEMYKKTDDNLWREQYARGLFIHFCHQTDMSKASELLGRLKALYEETPGNSEVALQYARGLFNYLNKQTNSTELDRILECLGAVYKENLGNSEVTELYAKGIVNYLANQVNYKKFEKVLESLEAVYRKHTDNNIIAAEYARGLFNYSIKQTYNSKLGKTLNRLKKVYSKNPGNSIIAELYSKVLFNYLFVQTNCRGLERVLGYLETVYMENPGNSKVVDSYADGLVYLINYQTDYLKSERTLERLEAVYQKNLGNSEVAVQCAKGIFNHIYKHIDNAESVRSLGRLEAVYKENIGNTEVADVCFRGLYYYYNHQTNNTKSKRVLESIEAIYKDNPDKEEFIIVYAKMLLDYLIYQTNNTDSEKVIERFGALYRKNRGKSFVVDVYALGLFEHFCHQTNNTDSERILKLLEAVYKDNPSNNDVATLYARGLVNIIAFMTDNIESERNLEHLKAVYTENPGNSEVAVQYARGLVNYVVHQEDNKKSEMILERLKAVYNENPSNSEVADAYANGIEILNYSSDG